MLLVERARLQLLRMAAPVTRLLGSVHLPYTRKRVKSEHYRILAKFLKPGMILLSRTEGELTNLFIPGYWGHAAIYVGNEQVVEAVGVGVKSTDLVDFCLTKDAVMTLEPLFADKRQMKNAAKWALDQVGKPYDYDFLSNNDAFYCSELVWLAYDMTMGNLPFIPRTTLGVPTITPEDYFRARSHWLPDQLVPPFSAYAKS